MMERRLSQLNMVREHLLNGNTITPIEALNMFGAFRLSHIIYVLRNEGMDIETHTIDDGVRRYAKYKLNNYNYDTKTSDRTL